MFSPQGRVVEFSSRSACRITGITPRQIQYWDEIGLLKPSTRAAAGRGSRRRYSFLDLLRLSVVRALIERGLAPRKIRKSLAALGEACPKALDPLAQMKLVTDGERLFLVTGDRRRILDVLERQFVFSIALAPLVRELRGRAERLAAYGAGSTRNAMIRGGRVSPRTVRVPRKDLAASERRERWQKQARA
ncbi:MAG TPA: MerR family transcriptional regulator [Candidatus Binatia bacterium]|nr:MerR family transcriptional regulator [Candidatus Binatia bacterium]